MPKYVTQEDLWAILESNEDRFEEIKQEISSNRGGDVLALKRI